MDFVLDSSDSDYINSPQVLKTRPFRKDLSLSSTASTSNVGSVGVKIENGRLYLSDAKKSAITRNELQAVYDRLDTPKAAATGNPISSLADTTQLKSKSNFDASRERMKLANIIDSETNADDTSDSIFLRPITMQAPLEKDGSSRFGLGGSKLKKTTNDSDRDSFDLKLSDFDDDGEDLLAEFSRPSRNLGGLSDSYFKSPSQQQQVANDEPTLGKLLHVDSNSEHTTPKLKNIRDELDQSKTRFRQSINELLNSSPISAASLEKNTGNIKELIKVGSKLSEQLITEVEASEKSQTQKISLEFSSLKKSLCNAGNNNNIQPADNTLQPPAPRRMTAEELKNLKIDQFENYTTSKATRSEKHQISMRRGEKFIQRLVWAISMLLLFIIIDFILQLLVARQEAGLPIVNFDFATTNRLGEYWQDLLWWLASKLGGGPKSYPIPH